MKLPVDALIAPEKLTGYLLQRREDNDKSGFLAVAGYTTAHAAQLDTDLRAQILPLSAEPAGTTPYGDKFVIHGMLRGPNGRTLRVLSVWMREKATGQTKFITLYPDPS